MTNPQQPRDRYWHIKAPKTHFPRARFRFGHQVGSHWVDEFGHSHYDIGIVIGMQYGASGYNRPEWAYLLRRLRSHSSPWMFGADDGFCIYESSLVLDYTEIDQNWLR